jgi:hypothetical protein
MEKLLRLSGTFSNVMSIIGASEKYGTEPGITSDISIYHYSKDKMTRFTFSYRHLSFKQMRQMQARISNSHQTAHGKSSVVCFGY